VAILLLGVGRRISWVRTLGVEHVSLEAGKNTIEPVFGGISMIHVFSLVLVGGIGDCLWELPLGSHRIVGVQIIRESVFHLCAFSAEAKPLALYTVVLHLAVLSVDVVGPRVDHFFEVSGEIRTSAPTQRSRTFIESAHAEGV